MSSPDPLCLELKTWQPIEERVLECECFGLGLNLRLSFYDVAKWATCRHDMLVEPCRIYYPDVLQLWWVETRGGERGRGVNENTRPPEFFENFRRPSPSFLYGSHPNPRHRRRLLH